MCKLCGFLLVINQVGDGRGVVPLDIVYPKFCKEFGLGPHGPHIGPHIVR